MNEATTFGDEKFEGRPAGHEGKAFRKALELCWTERAHISSFIDSGMRRDGHAPRAGEIVFKLGILPPDDPEDFKITPNVRSTI